MIKPTYEELEKRVKKLEKALFNEKDFTETILNAQQDTFLLFEPTTGKVIHWNRAFNDITGYTDEEIAGMAAPDSYYSPEDLERASILTQDVMGIGTGTIELELICKDGHKIPTEYKVSVIKDNEGKPKYFISIGRDVSDRKRAEEELVRHRVHLEKLVEERSADLRKTNKQLENVMEASTQVAIMAVDMNGMFTLFNTGAENTFGYRSEEVIGKSTPEIMLYEDGLQIFGAAIADKVWRPVERSELLSADVLSGVLEGFETAAKRKDGKWIYVSLNLSPLKDENNQTTGILGIAYDITERNAFENELKHAKEDAEAANVAKSEFLANMSHEIRTPMNAIIGMSELIMSTDMTQKQRDFLKIIRTSSRSLLWIINDIMDFSKIEAGKLDIESIPITLRDIIEVIPDMFVENIMEKEIEIILDIDPGIPERIICDPVRLRQILVNLVSNAFKFTEEGHIGVSVCKQSMTDKTVELLFSVSDTGIGFDTKIKDNLFKAFAQADGSTTRKYGGTGLGLTICRRLVDMMGGEIWAKSEPGKGSSFCFTINVVISRDRPDRDFTTYSSLKNKKILIVDDNPSTREIMKLYVSSFGFMAETADSAFSALDLYNESKLGEQYDLIIMDIKMPGKDGVTACEEILNDAGSNAPAIIIMSASFRQDDIKRMQMANIDSFIMKPIKKSSLFDAINEQFGYKPSRLKNFSSEITKQDDFSDVSILLVEDNPINQIVASEILMAVDARVVKAGTGIEAIDVLKHEQVDAVLMDVQMPEMDGFEATRIIRNGLKMADLPIIAMTAHTMQGDREACIAAGMNDYLPKPIDSKELFRVLKKNIARLKDKQLSSADEITIHTIDKSILPEILPGIDVESGLKRVNGNRTLLVRIIREFKRDHADAAGRIKNALEKKDMELALRLSHTIKGVAANCSAMDLATSAQNLESGIKKRQNDKYKDLLNDFDVLLKQVLEAAAILEQRNDEEKIVEKSVDKNFSEANRLISKLSGYLKQRNNVKAEACMEGIKQYLCNTKFHDEAIKLEDKIDRMDYKSAHNILSLLADKMEILVDEVDK